MQTVQERVILPFEASGEYYFDPVEPKRKTVYEFVKRVFDIVASLGVGILFSIPMLVIALLIRVTSEGPAIYRQERLGKNGVPFMIMKFRSMVIDAEEQGAQWAHGERDPRTTPIGRFLRATHLDELPQLWNILLGQMSFVGPRPEREVFYDEFERYIHGFHERLKVVPGLTGYAQVNGGYELRPEEKLKYDLEYISRRSIFLDLWCIFKTFALVFGGGK